MIVKDEVIGKYRIKIINSSTHIIRMYRDFGNGEIEVGSSPHDNLHDALTRLEEIRPALEEISLK